MRSSLPAHSKINWTPRRYPGPEVTAGNILDLAAYEPIQDGRICIEAMTIVAAFSPRPVRYARFCS